MVIQDIVPNINVENYKTEFKIRLLDGLDKHGEDNALKWLKELVAFANTQGGTLYVGVDDKTHGIDPLSHKEVDETTRRIYEKTSQRIEPNIDVYIHEILAGKSVPQKYVLQVDVRKSVHTPVYVHVNGVPVCYIRQFGRVKIASPDQIAQLVISSSRANYDTLQTGEIYHPEDFKKLRSAYSSSNGGKELTDKALESIGFMTEEKRLAKGALLFKDANNDPITLVKATVFKSYDKGGDTVLAKDDFQGCLLDMLNKSIAFIKNHSVEGYRKTSNGRIDLYSYPNRAVLEGVVNALAHRNYFIFGTEIELNIFPDRLEITSPGSLLGGKNLNRETKISSIQPKRRNELICRVFELVHLMEAKGTGFDKIEQAYTGADEKHQPFVSCDDESFTLTLPDLSFSQGVIGVSNPYPEIHLPSPIVSDYDARILSCCYSKDRNLTEIADYLGVSPSTYLRAKILEKLVEAGYLYRRQKGRGFYYLTNRNKVENFL